MSSAQSNVLVLYGEPKVQKIELRSFLLAQPGVPPELELDPGICLGVDDNTRLSTLGVDPTIVVWPKGVRNADSSSPIMAALAKSTAELQELHNPVLPSNELKSSAQNAEKDKNKKKKKTGLPSTAAPISPLVGSGSIALIASESILPIEAVPSHTQMWHEFKALKQIVTEHEHTISHLQVENVDLKLEIAGLKQSNINIMEVLLGN